MTKMKNVVLVYLHQDQTVKVLKEKRQDFKNGGFILEVTAVTKTRESIYARLECGHIRKQSTGESFRGAKRLSCFNCDDVVPLTPDMQDWREKHAAANLVLAKVHTLTLMPLPS